MPRRVLILSASSGAGHVRAAQALEKAFAARGDCSVEHIDALDYTSKLFQKIYEDAYIALVRLALDRLNTRPMIRLLERVQPDLCVATHFLPAEIIAWLKHKRILRARHAIVVTDYDVHAMWLCRDVDLYCVADAEAAEYLARVGVPREKLRATGIPVDPIFAQPLDPRETRRLELDPERTTLLVSAGGYGVGPMERLVTDLLASGRPWQIVAVAGKAEKVRKRLEEVARNAPDSQKGTRLRVLGFTTEMDQWMAAADLLVGKAGGLTTSEALARGLPMTLIEPISGQEERNADRLLEGGAAIRCNNLPAAGWKIAALLDDPERLGRMRAAACAMARPLAAMEIAEETLKLLS